MPNAWSKKDERQYEHIKQSAQERGRTTERSREVAARTVNKQRREEGRTKETQSDPTGNPDKPLDERTMQEVYNRAKELDITGRSKMTKAELIKAIQDNS